LELAGQPRSTDLDAISLAPLFRGETMPAARDLYFVRREGGPEYGGKSYEALIRGDWKLMQNTPFSPYELYNLKDDPYEKINLAAANKKVVNDLSASLRRHIQRGGSVPWQKPISDAASAR
jgi:arylsulfatase A-like enzyme